MFLHVTVAFFGGKNSWQSKKLTLTAASSGDLVGGLDTDDKVMGEQNGAVIVFGSRKGLHWKT